MNSRVQKTLKKIYYKLEPYDYFNFAEKYKQKYYEYNSTKLLESERLESCLPYKATVDLRHKKPFVGLVKSEEHQYSYWPKFERYLIENKIPYEFFEVKKSNFIEKAEKYDIIVWRTLSLYSEQWEAKEKVEFLEKHLNKLILPKAESLWFYEDKIRQAWLYEYYNLPFIKTFITHDKREALTYVENSNYPIVSKDKTSSSANGVRLINNKIEAKKHVIEIFTKGLKLPETYIKQKNYVIFQEKVPNEGFDLRVIIIGNYYLGYYRYPNKGDFRASGSGVVEKKEIPKEVLLLAKKVKNVLPDTNMLAVDFLQDSRDMKYYIIETSLFISVESSEQLYVDGSPGRYIEEDGEFRFEEGRFWIQELMMDEVVKNWVNGDGKDE